MSLKITDCTLSNILHKFGLAATDYWNSFIVFDGPEPMRMNYLKSCREEMEHRHEAVLKYVTENYERKYDEF